MSTERLEFLGADGQKLAARLDTPAGAIQAFALYAHCFTCGKDIFAASRIALALTEHGIAVLRFDFTGLGASEGEFANTNFSSNVADLVAAANYLRQAYRAPAILIGHSLGGAAVLAAASAIPEVQAVVTIAAPSDPAHVVGLFREQIDQIQAAGEANVQLAGRPFRIKQQFLLDVAEQSLTDKIANLGKALLVMHAPGDTTVDISNAAHIYTAAKHPKSFVSLDDADHLLTRKSDAIYVANLIAAWSQRYVSENRAEDLPQSTTTEAEEGLVCVEETGQGKFQQQITVGQHRLIADEPVAVGGLGSGPGPYDLLLASLGACTAMTLRMYADHKGLPLDTVSVTLRHNKIYANDCAQCDTREGKIDQIDRVVSLQGALSETQRAQLMAIADKCPVHRTLHSEVMVRTVEQP